MVGATNQTLRPFLWRAGKLYPDREIVSRTAEGLERYTYAEYEGRVARLAGALSDAGIGDGDRVATFCWNHNRHFETYFGVPSMGAQLHTINPLLPDHHIQYIVENAKDRIIFVDPSLAPKLAGAVDGDAFASVEQFVVMASEVPDDVGLSPVTDYESFIADHPDEYDWPDLPEDQPAGMCYTSGTTGQPKGVEYSQQMLWAHTMATLPESGLDIGAKDVIMPVVPMFHVNAWGLPFSTTAAGAKHVYPGPSPTPEDLATLIEEEGVTMTAGVPTVWLGLLDYLDEHDADISSLERIIIGGSAAPKSVIRRFDEEHDVDVLHAWGMTEMSPVGTVAHLKPGMEDLPAEAQYEKRAKQGLLAPGLEMRVVDDDGNEVPWDDEEFGELWVRGPWVTTEYFERPDANEEDYEDGWLKTGDVVTVDEDGYVQIVDRAKDVIKSGGEWISSLELENSIMAHDDVAEATVIGVPHERWQERPVAFIVPKGGVDEDALKADLVARVEDEFPKWWAPDEVVFIDEVPKTATGKFDKKVLRDRYDDSSLIEGKTPDSEAPSDE
ncbi:long-chain fatty acid--CoA ligase [Haloferax volcanii]|uniref:Acyl-CoA synthetase n=3 Tax=Haloferax volcanii TaxID=2246 RepID=D4GXS7_HALVD|nr:long-chain fatty acid--CoA ligase [Haloferax volcanii]ADE04119.1 acyl-CoA synthetase [Haloferax volcanii DS2]ELY27940.1 acyl-CoA synthetase [Haloferax volcanii DS2]MBS8117812.1 long-chain fatty acid--CoA ligase [Haloferax volcanii]MBS8122824.1 long-chain fatty acid--CoA ligase [Haloferax volcanii]MBS8126692.1 long-chain fatty acid--CoA ligase [Haloferax volcanii]